LILLDVSGSMNERISSGGTKFVRRSGRSGRWPTTCRRVPRSACGCTALRSPNEMPVGPLDRAKMYRAVRSFDAKGETPIAYSLEQSVNDLGSSGRRVVVLVPMARRPAPRIRARRRGSWPPLVWICNSTRLDWRSMARPAGSWSASPMPATARIMTPPARPISPKRLASSRSALCGPSRSAALRSRVRRIPPRPQLGPGQYADPTMLPTALAITGFRGRRVRRSPRRSPAW
jgi:hypothetical protein